MIKMPKEVKEIIRALRDKGYEAYAAGICVRSCLAGEKPLDWDVNTNAGLDAIKEIFPEGEVVSEKFSVVRLYGNEDAEDPIITDIGTFRMKTAEDGTVPFTDDVKEDLRRRDFTVNAMADNGFEFIDEFGGRSDMQAKLVRTIGSADELFRKEPVKMLKALRITASLGYDLTKDVYEAILKNHALVRDLPVKNLRGDFMAIMGGPSGGKALNMIVDMGMLPDIIGEAGEKLSGREKSDLMILCQNMDKTKPIASRRMGALISILSEKKGLSVIDRLDFTGKIRLNLTDVAKDLPNFHFAQQPAAYKKFIYEHEPMERSDYLLNLQKALMIIFDYSIETKVKSKMYLLNEFERNNDPIFVEDLVINAEDLMEEGISDDPEECDKLLHMLVERLHIEPKKNTRRDLLELAKKYKKNKMAAYLRGVSWIR
ncbi:MAG: CCA tRNA nucleotidyltransferase [Firmicutes bacterium]|nr:CCA tRNA nucleotidyltransferase [Bacillota bacterium]